MGQIGLARPNLATDLTWVGLVWINLNLYKWWVGLGPLWKSTTLPNSGCRTGLAHPMGGLGRDKLARSESTQFFFFFGFLGVDTWGLIGWAELGPKSQMGTPKMGWADVTGRSNWVSVSNEPSCSNGLDFAKCPVRIQLSTDLEPGRAKFWLKGGLGFFSPLCLGPNSSSITKY